MARTTRDALRRFELLLLALGALAATVVLVVNAGDDVRHLAGLAHPEGRIGLYSVKLLLVEAALVAPFLVLALLSRALLRETTRAGYRWAGFAISLVASAGVAGMLAAGLIRVDLDHAINALIAGVVPALVLLTGCAGLYGGLIWLAQHGQLDRFIPSRRGHSSRSARD